MQQVGMFDENIESTKNTNNNKNRIRKHIRNTHSPFTRIILKMCCVDELAWPNEMLSALSKLVAS